MLDKEKRSYTNGEITVYWDPTECVHAGICFRELHDVFDPARRPWIDLSKADTKQIIDIVERCPTDALTFEYSSKGEKMQTKNNPPKYSQIPKPEFKIMRNGPILANGAFTLINPDNTQKQINTITSFCRCGMSQNQPYCDGTHNKKGFSPDPYNF